jgi:hypothetical protein
MEDINVDPGESTVHPYFKQAMAQSHIDELHRQAARRRIGARRDAPRGGVKLGWRRRASQPRPAARGRTASAVRSSERGLSLRT